MKWYFSLTRTVIFVQMQLYYLPNITETNYLGVDESKHLLKVMRKKMGDEFNATDGKGNKFVCLIIEDNIKKLKFQIRETEHIKKEEAEFHLMIALTKNSSRIEWMLEKCTEIGISSIRPITCEKSEQKHFRKDRFERILAAALKQSQRFYLPHLFDSLKVEEALQQTVSDNKYIASYNKDNIFLQEQLKAGESITMVIGPEGDFTSKELNFAKELNFSCVNLSHARLRTETAALQACSIFNSINKR